MKTEFKEIGFICRCGDYIQHTILVCDEYGFDTVYCDCGLKYKVEYCDRTTAVSLLRGKSYETV